MMGIEPNKMSDSATKFSQRVFGKLPDGKTVNCYTITNSKGTTVSVINYGAIILSLELATKNGRKDVVLGFDTLEDYIKSHLLPAPPYFGAVVGRYAGRIKDGSFKIDEKNFQLHLNNGINTLHGGKIGFDQLYWEVKVMDDAEDTSITFTYTSPAGEENFPGQLDAEVTYTLTSQDEVVIEYKATSTEDTIVNLTQHSYFNLDGHQKNVLSQELIINSTLILEINAANIPSGNLINAADKGFDFSTGRNCPAIIDDSFVIVDNSAPAAMLKSKKSGLQLTVFSDQPSLHIYVGGSCFWMKGKGGTEYHPHSGICFESQNYPDAPNHNNFPNAILRKGNIYSQKTTWKFDHIN